MTHLHLCVPVTPRCRTGEGDRPLCFKFALTFPPYCMAGTGTDEAAATPGGGSSSTEGHSPEDSAAAAASDPAAASGIRRPPSGTAPAPPPRAGAPYKAPVPQLHRLFPGASPPVPPPGAGKAPVPPPSSSKPTPTAQARTLPSAMPAPTPLPPLNIGGALGTKEKKVKGGETAAALDRFTTEFAAQQAKDRKLAMRLELRSRAAAQEERTHQQKLADGCKQQ